MYVAQNRTGGADRTGGGGVCSSVRQIGPEVEVYVAQIGPEVEVYVAPLGR